MISAVTSVLCATLCGRRPALPAGRPSYGNPCETEDGGGTCGNHGFPHVG